MEIKNKKIIFISVAFILILVFSAFVNLAYASEITVAKVISLVNSSRNDEGLVDLTENETLDKIARDKLEDMIKNNYFAHTSPKGVTPWSWYEKEGYDYKYAGENLAINFLTAEAQHKAWMESPTHKKNIMNPQFQEIGVAVAAGEINNQLAIVTVQEFGTLAGAAGKANNPENFSGKEKNNILKEEKEIAPTVLSTKEEKRENDYLPGAGEQTKTEKLASYKTLEDISLMVFLAALFLMPAVFVGEAMKKVMVILKSGEKSEVQAL